MSDTIRMKTKPEEGIGDSVWPKSKLDGQGEVPVYETAVRPAIMYGAETWGVKKAHEKKLHADVKMDEWSHQAGHN